ncbi:MAG: hypothetical protein WAU89_12495 [Candidatus Acidiferrales bacterium]
MTAEKTAMPFGWRFYGLGVMALGLASLVFREFDPGQPVPDNFPARTVLACVVGAFIVLAAAAIEWRRTVVWGAAALAVYYTLFVVVLMNGRVLLTDYAVYVTYENIAMQLSIAVGALIVFASTARIDAALAARLTRVGQLAFGVCALVFGGAHFVYMNMTAPMVPKWLPPSQVFWGYATGVCFVAAGLAILSGVRARLAAILLTVMLACFGLLANLPILLGDHASHFNWTESAVNLAVVGAAWVVADSLARRTPLATTN